MGKAAPISDSKRTVSFGRIGKVRTLIAHHEQRTYAENGVMEATKAAAMPEPKRIRMAGELLKLASASLAAGLLVAIVAAAVVMLLAQPIYSDELERSGIASAATSR